MSWLVRQRKDKKRGLAVPSLPIVIRLLSLTALFLPLIASAEDLPLRPHANIFDPVSTPAQSIYNISILVLIICAVIFFVVAGILVYTIIRFRKRPDDDGREPPQVYGGTQIELAWTVLPILITIVL